MPSLTLSLPAISVLGPGLMPVAPSPAPVLGPGVTPAPVPLPPGGLPPAAPVPGEDFAALIADAGATPILDAAPALKPSIGTPLPPERQEVAGDPAPLPAVDVENVMLGSATVPPPQAEAPAPQAEVTIDLPTVCPAPVPDEGPIACGLQTWQRHGASHIILARANLRPVAPDPIELPPEEIPDFTAVEPGVERPAPDQPEKLLAQPDTAPAAPTVPFAPSAPGDIVQPQMAAPANQASRSSESASKPAARKEPGVQPVPSIPVMTSTAAIPAANDATPPRTDDRPLARAPSGVYEAAATPTDRPGQRSEQPSAGAPAPVPAAPAAPSAAARAAAPLPHGFSLPPELAREVAEIVRAATRSSDDARPATIAPVDATASVLELQPAPPVSAPLHPGFAPAHRPVIDTGRAEWMQAMIERIAEMPQADGNREAQLRLRPDALGVVDVKIVERQERLHVTLHAENPQARQLLAEAAPRLHELAEARGLRLGQTGIGGGGEQQERRPAPDQQPATPLRPRRASPAAEPDSQTPGDLIA